MPGPGGVTNFPQYTCQPVDHPDFGVHQQPGDEFVIAAPDYDLTSSVEDDHLTFEAVVEIRPTVNPAGYQSLRVTIDNPAVSDGELDEQIERLRNAYAQLESVEGITAAVDRAWEAKKEEIMEGFFPESEEFREGEGI